LLRPLHLRVISAAFRYSLFSEVIIAKNAGGLLPDKGCEKGVFRLMDFAKAFGAPPRFGLFGKRCRIEP
jgi:hypothetical protein